MPDVSSTMLKPLPPGAWNFDTASHLLNRAGFGGKPEEIRELAGLGLDRAVSRLVEVHAIPDPAADPEWAHPDPERVERLAAIRKAPEPERREMQRQEQRLQRERMQELRVWWLERMVRTPRPLQEKLTLFWHGHFATSFEKVRDSYYMWRQNELFRRVGLGDWLTILVETAQDPAMLIWLDQAQSRKEHPNENFAREVMELFALGEGNYSERDVTEAARAFTGWTLDRAAQRFVVRPRTHDAGPKEILGKRGHFAGEDVLEIIASHPQSAKFITGRLWNFFAGEPPAPDLNDALADAFRDNGSHVGPFLKTMFSSAAFYDERLIRNQIKSPVQWLVGTVRLLERELPNPAYCANLLRLLGQDLFAPPNVKGWDGGVAWISTNTLMTRFNAAAELVEGERLAPGRTARDEQGPRRRRAASAVNPRRLFTSEELADSARLLEAAQRRFLQATLKGPAREQLRGAIESSGRLDDDAARAAIRLVLCTTEYQLS